MSACENCGGAWAGAACLDCGATPEILALATARPGGVAAQLLALLRDTDTEREGL